jgi:hypothetical protein
MPSTDDVLDAYHDELRRLGTPVTPPPASDRPPSIVLVHPDPDAA